MSSVKSVKTRSEITFCIISLILFPLAFSAWVSLFTAEPAVTTQFSDAEIQEICARLKFEIASDEKISVKFRAGALQLSPYLKVKIENISSEEDFLSRFYGNISVIESYRSFPDALNSHKVSLFEFENIPKDYFCYLNFYNDTCTGSEEKLYAEFDISGYIPDLKEIYNFSTDYITPLISSWSFMSLLIIEIILTIIFIVQIRIYFIQKHKDAVK